MWGGTPRKLHFENTKSHFQLITIFHPMSICKFHKLSIRRFRGRAERKKINMRIRKCEHACSRSRIRVFTNADRRIHEQREGKPPTYPSGGYLTQRRRAAEDAEFFGIDGDRPRLSIPHSQSAIDAKVRRRTTKASMI